MNAPDAILNRTIARTASFCSERNGHNDGSQWHQVRAVAFVRECIQS